MNPVALYIDDSAVERRIVKRLLEEGGFRVFTAERTEDGLELAGKVSPDVILLDLHLEGMGGCQLAEELRKIPQLEKIPILAISASLREEERPEILERFDGYIQKPVDVDTLPRIVREFMEQAAKTERQKHEASRPGMGGAITSPVEGEADSKTASQADQGGDGESAISAGTDILEVLNTLERLRSVMSHDLRTPLTVMISYASTVGRGKVGEVNERQREMLDLVVQHGFQMDAQIAELVRLARETLKRFGYPAGGC
ncbi:MAG: response regulator [Actinomycetota bacterium]